MIRIPYQIPMPERAELVAAGKEACRLALDHRDTSAHKAAQATVHKVIADISLKYGIEEAGE